MAFHAFCRQPPDALRHRLLPLEQRDGLPGSLGSPRPSRSQLKPPVWISSVTSRLTVAPGRIAFVSCGLRVHLRLLPTSPPGDAVTLGWT